MSTKKKEYDKNYKAKHRKELNEYNMVWRSNHREQMMLTGAKSRAKIANLDFDLELIDIVIPSFCPALGIPLCKGSKQLHYNSPSLDRIDNTKGYIKGNVIVISQQANAIKSDTPVTDLYGKAIEFERAASNYKKVAGFYQSLLSEGV